MNTAVAAAPSAAGLSPYTARLRESLVAMLTEHVDPMPTVMLQAAHGRTDQVIYTQLRALAVAGLVRSFSISGIKATYWCTADARPGTCVCTGCVEPGRQFVPPALPESRLYKGIRLKWRSVLEHPDSGGWVCADRAHATAMWRARRTHLSPLHACALDGGRPIGVASPWTTRSGA